MIQSENLEDRMDKSYHDTLLNKAKEKRVRNIERKKRRIELGYENGKILPNGNAVIIKPKGIQHWYSTRQLIQMITVIFDKNEALTGKRICHINGKWQLQIRGKHLRRLLKAMPKVKQIGRMLVEEN